MSRLHDDTAAIIAWLRLPDTYRAAWNGTMAQSGADIASACQWLANAIERGARDTLADSDGDDGA